MKDVNRVRADSPSIFAIVAALCFGACFLFVQQEPNSFEQQLTRALFGFLFLASTWMFFRSMLCPVYLTEDGIECYRFGNVHRFLPWDQVGQVSIATYQRPSRHIGAGSVIIITPIGVSKMRRDEYGADYLRDLRGAVIRVEHTCDRLAFIEKHCEVPADDFRQNLLSQL